MHLWGYDAMATAKPRITVTLNKRQYELIRRMAALRGVSMSGLLVELLEGVETVLERVLMVMEAAARAENDYKAGLIRTAEKAEQELQGLMQLAMDQFSAMEEAANAGGKGLAPASGGDGGGNSRCCNNGGQVGDIGSLNKTTERLRESQERRFRVIDKATGADAMPGLTWSGEAALETLEGLKRRQPGREWVLLLVEDEHTGGSSDAKS